MARSQFSGTERLGFFRGFARRAWRRGLSLQAGGAGDFGPTVEFTANESAELIWAGIERLVALFGQEIDRRRRVHRLVGGGGERVDPRLWRPGRRKEPEPQAGVEIGHTGFRHGRHLG